MEGISSLSASHHLPKLPSLSWQGMVVTELVFATSLFVGKRLAGKDADNLHIMAWTIASLATTTLALYCGGARFLLRFGLFIPTDGRRLINFFAFNVFGRAFSLWVSSSRLSSPSVTPSRLPNGVKEVMEMEEQTVREHAAYYESHNAELQALSPKQRFAFEQRCLDLEIDSLRFLYALGDEENWTVEDCAYVREHDWDLPVTITPSFEKASYFYHLSPPNEIQTGTVEHLIALAADDAFDPASLTANQLDWFKKCRHVWKDIPPHIQWGLSREEGFPKHLTPPTTLAQVRALPPDAVRWYYNQDRYENLDNETLLALFERYMDLNLRPTNAIIDLLPNILNIPELTTETIAEASIPFLKLCSLHFDESDSWGGLRASIQWAFTVCDLGEHHPWPNKYRFPMADEIEALPDQAIRHYYENFQNIIENNYLFFKRFYSLSLPPAHRPVNMLDLLTEILTDVIATEDANPWPLSLVPSLNFQELDYQQANWLRTCFDFNEQWNAFPLVVQHRLSLRKVGEVTSTPTLEQIRALDEPGVTQKERRDIATVLHDSFEDIEAIKNAELLRAVLLLFMKVGLEAKIPADETPVLEPPADVVNSLHLSWLAHFARQEGENQETWRERFALEARRRDVDIPDDLAPPPEQQLVLTLGEEA